MAQDPGPRKVIGIDDALSKLPEGSVCWELDRRYWGAYPSNRKLCHFPQFGILFLHHFIALSSSEQRHLLNRFVFGEAQMRGAVGTPEIHEDTLEDNMFYCSDNL